MWSVRSAKGVRVLRVLLVSGSLGFSVKCMRRYRGGGGVNMGSKGGGQEGRRELPRFLGAVRRLREFD